MVFSTRSIYWFRRDLRTRDNRGLLRALDSSDEVMAIYVFEKRFIEELRENHHYLSFLLNAVANLSKKIKLNIFYGDIYEVFDSLLASLKPSAVYTSIPLSWSETRMSRHVSEICRRYGAKYIEVIDNALSDPRQSYPLVNFTSFYKSWLGKLDTDVYPDISSKKFIDIGGLSIEEIASKMGIRPIETEHSRIEWGQERINSFKFESYDRLRDYPYIDGTSRLSHFINLGVLSIREIYNKAIERSREYIRQLAWREYYLVLSNRYPWMEHGELKPYMQEFEWENNKYYIDCFIQGKTGYPIVDAGIRQLRREGWIHNRIRLVVASFLVKDLLVDWRVGAEFFKKTLIDYDEVINTGNWQWAASVGVDPIPSRVFNPIRQAERYDPMCLYIKKYLPELEDEECRALHNPLAYKIKGYYEPIVDHFEAVKKYSELVRRRLLEWRSRRGDEKPRLI